ncbi:MAG: hypothetical protein K2J79_09435 [Ruminiclostridium sp.]|nr:hypothetical protein [Ruminiclostridium sp.]
MLKKKISKILFLTTALSMLTACQSNATPNPDITVFEESKIFETNEFIESDNNIIITDDGEDIGNMEQSRDLKTDKPFIPAEELYNTEKKNIDADVFKKGFHLNFVDGNRFFFSQNTLGKAFYNLMPYEELVEKAVIAMYDLDKGETMVVLSEGPKGDEYGLSLYPLTTYSSYLYFFRIDNKAFAELCEEISLWRVNLNNGTPEKLFTLESKGNIKNPVQLDSFMYFYEPCEAEVGGKDSIWVIYQCDLKTGETSVFRYNAERPLTYKNGIIYYHNGGFYYHGDSSVVTGKGSFYKGDELIFYPNPDSSNRVSGINSKNDVIIYTYDIYDSNNYATGSVLGVFDEDFKRVDIGSTLLPAQYITADYCCISDSGLISVENAAKPLIYDAQNDSFSEISIDGYSMYSVFAAEDGLRILAYEIDDDKNYSSVAMYTVTRKQ